jgi:four helix bundle protein
MHKSQELKERTKQFAVRIVKLLRSLPRTEEARVIGKQVLRSGTSVAANYRAVCRARPRRSLSRSSESSSRSRMKLFYGLELLVETEIVPKGRMSGLMSEANELLAIFAASQYTARKGQALMKR